LPAMWYCNPPPAVHPLRKTVALSEKPGAAPPVVPTSWVRVSV